MAKRRTRAQKIKAQNKFKLNPNLFLSPNKDGDSEPVKSYFPKEEKIKLATKISPNNSVNMEQFSNLKLIKKDITKSLITFGFMLCLIVVIYLLWYK